MVPDFSYPYFYCYDTLVVYHTIYMVVLLVMDWPLLVSWFLFRLPDIKIYRWYKGGLWVHFATNEWIQCTWYDKELGYINNKFDGGMFHIKFNLITKIEDYS